MKLLRKYIQPQARLITLSEKFSLCIGSDETEFGGNGGGIPAASNHRITSIWDSEEEASYLHKPAFFTKK